MRLSKRLQRANLLKGAENKPSPVGGKLSAYFAIALYDEKIGKMKGYEQLINHANKQTQA